MQFYAVNLYDIHKIVGFQMKGQCGDPGWVAPMPWPLPLCVEVADRSC